MLRLGGPLNQIVQTIREPAMNKDGRSYSSTALQFSELLYAIPITPSPGLQEAIEHPCSVYKVARLLLTI